MTTPETLARPPCATLNGEGRPCRYRAKRGDIYCKRHRRCECCDNRCPAMARLCRPCALKGCAVPPGPPRDPGEWAQTKAARRRPVDAYEYSQRPMAPAAEGR